MMRDITLEKPCYLWGIGIANPRWLVIEGFDRFLALKDTQQNNMGVKRLRLSPTYLPYTSSDLY
jgi:hypothetical protein